MGNGALLAELAGKEEAALADSIVLLANACKRVVAAQPTVVRVRVPSCNIFAGVHDCHSDCRGRPLRTP